jgi:hypothetical protein
MPAYVTKLALHLDGLHVAWEDSDVPVEYRPNVVIEPYEKVSGEPVPRTWSEVQAALAITSPKNYWFIYSGDGTGVPGVQWYPGVIPPWVDDVLPPINLDPTYSDNLRDTINTLLALMDDPVEWPKVIEKFHRNEDIESTAAFQKVLELMSRLGDLIGG